MVTNFNVAIWANHETKILATKTRYMVWTTIHIYYIKLKSRLFVCLSDRDTDISAVSAWIEVGLAQNESWVFWDHKVYF